MTLNPNVDSIEISEIDNKKTNIIFDTNFLFITFKYDIDIIRELDRIIENNYQLYIIDKTINELQNIIDKKKKDKKYIKLILKFLSIYNIKSIISPQTDNTYVDDIILELPNKNFLIATMDKELRLKLHKKKLQKCIVFRQKKYLEVM